MNKTNVEKHLELLGFNVKDKITGFEGVVSSISFDVYGCIQATVTPMSKDGECPESVWIDVIRLDPTSEKPVMTPRIY